MHFNIYVDDTTGQQLKLQAEKQGETRNALIRRILRAWLQEKADTTKWPALVQNFQGIPATQPFEALRDHLKPPAQDPLA